jgi:DNA-binding transcriptional MerR regulator
MADHAKRYTSGQIARLAGLSADSIRHYERVGILPRAVRTESGYRQYGEDALLRVRLVQAALKIGFGLRELAEVFRIRDQGGAPCQRVFKLTEQKLKDVRRQIEELRETEQTMRQVLRKWSALMTKAGPGRRAFLLQALEHKTPKKKPGIPRLRRRALS